VQRVADSRLDGDGDFRKTIDHDKADGESESLEEPDSEEDTPRSAQTTLGSCPRPTNALRLIVDVTMNQRAENENCAAAITDFAPDAT
jgi:hypothetical protein